MSPRRAHLSHCVPRSPLRGRGARTPRPRMQCSMRRRHVPSRVRPLYNPEVEVNADDEGPDRTLTMEMSMPIDLSGKRAARSDVARATLDVTTAAAQLRRRDFAKGWVTARASRVTADRRVTLGNQRVALLDRFAELAERAIPSRRRLPAGPRLGIARARRGRRRPGVAARRACRGRGGRAPSRRRRERAATVTRTGRGAAVGRGRPRRTWRRCQSGCWRSRRPRQAAPRS